jgi:hypothetical protein
MARMTQVALAPTVQSDWHLLNDAVRLKKVAHHLQWMITTTYGDYLASSRLRFVVWTLAIKHRFFHSLDGKPARTRHWKTHLLHALKPGTGERDAFPSSRYCVKRLRKDGGFGGTIV